MLRPKLLSTEKKGKARGDEMGEGYRGKEREVKSKRYL